MKHKQCMRLTQYVTDIKAEVGEDKKYIKISQKKILDCLLFIVKALDLLIGMCRECQQL